MQSILEDYAEDNPTKDVDSKQVFQYNIDTYTNAIPVERLVNDFNAGIIKIPPFQRPYVWQKKDPKTERHRPSLFIDSILQGLPIPPISIYKDATAREEGLLIDGQQRIKTLSWFMTGILEGKKNKFSLKGEGINEAWIGKSFTDLDIQYKDFLKRAYIPVTYIRQLNEDRPPMPNASSLYVLFDRLNSGGFSLEPHEKRSVLIIYNKNSDGLKYFLDKIYAMPEWDHILPNINIDEDPSQITKRHELIFRVYAFLLYKDKYKGNIAKFLDDFMLNYQMLNNEANKLIELTNIALSLLIELKNSIGRLFYPNGKFNTAFYESFFIALLSQLKQNIIPTITALSSIYNNITKLQLYYGKTIGSKASNVDIKVVNTRINNIINQFSIQNA